MLNNTMTDIIACPKCKNRVDLIDEELVCNYCNTNYKIINDIPVMLNGKTPFKPDKDKISSAINYHLRELDTAKDAYDHRHLNPNVKNEHKAILDIGCGIGQSFIGTGIYNDNTRNLLGIDIDFEALTYGKLQYSNISFINSYGENLPIISNSIDLVISRVSLPYTNIPLVIKEIHRVLKINGELWITLHSFNMTAKSLFRSTKNLKYRDMIFRTYVVLNGFIFHFFGKLFTFPIFGRVESFQTNKAIRRLLKKENFGNIEIMRERHFLVKAVKKN